VQEYFILTGFWHSFGKKLSDDATLYLIRFLSGENSAIARNDKIKGLLLNKLLTRFYILLQQLSAKFVFCLF
jgi:hypothetical protein